MGQHDAADLSFCAVRGVHGVHDICVRTDARIGAHYLLARHLAGDAGAAGAEREGQEGQEDRGEKAPAAKYFRCVHACRSSSQIADILESHALARKPGAPAPHCSFMQIT